MKRNNEHTIKQVRDIQFFFSQTKRFEVNF